MTSWECKLDVKGRLEVSSENNIKKSPENFGMNDAKELFTSVAEKLRISKLDCPDGGSQEEKEIKNSSCRGTIGCLNYLANTTRPDKTFVL